MMSAVRKVVYKHIRAMLEELSRTPQDEEFHYTEQAETVKADSEEGPVWLQGPGRFITIDLTGRALKPPQALDNEA